MLNELMLVTYPYASMALTWDNRDPGQRDPIYGTKGSLWDKGILFMGQYLPIKIKHIFENKNHLN